MEDSKRDWTLSNTAPPLKFGQWNFLASILTLPFINSSKFYFWENYLPSRTYTNIVISVFLTTRQDGFQNST